MLWQSVCGLEKNVQTQSISERREAIESREQSPCELCECRGPTSHRPGRVHCGLAANVFSLETKKVPAGRLVLGDQLGCYLGMGILA